MTPVLSIGVEIYTTLIFYIIYLSSDKQLSPPTYSSIRSIQSYPALIGIFDKAVHF